MSNFNCSKIPNLVLFLYWIIIWILKNKQNRVRTFFVWVHSLSWLLCKWFEEKNAHFIKKSSKIKIFSIDDLCGKWGVSLSFLVQGLEQLSVIKERSLFVFKDYKLIQLNKRSNRTWHSNKSYELDHFLFMIIIFIFRRLVSILIHSSDGYIQMMVTKQFD